MKNWHLQKKINVILIIAFLSCSILLSIIHISFQNQRINTVTNKIVLILKTLVERDRRALANEIFEKRKRAIQLRTKQMSMVKGILSITVFNLSGTTLHQHTATNMKKESILETLSLEMIDNCIKNLQIRNEEFNGEKVLSYYQQISAIDETVGFIKINYSLSDVDLEKKISFLLLSFQLIILFLVLFVIIKIFISKSIIKPLDNLQIKIGEMNFGKLGVEVPVTSNDEIGKLSVAFNRMSNDLLKAQNYISNVINSMPSVLIGVDNIGNVTQWNKAAEKATNIQAKDAENKNLLDVYPQMADEMDNITESIKTKEIRKDINKKHLTQTETSYEDIVIYPLITNGAEGAVIRIDDVTKQFTLQQQLNQSRKMEAIGTLAGGIAHDFNNILSPILGYAEMLQEDLPQNSPLKNKASEIFKASLRAKDLVQQILTFSRQGDHKIKAIKLQYILKEALKLLGSSIPKTIDIKADIDIDCGMVIAEPTQIHQIIMNLATNAYHAMQKSGGLMKVTLKQIKIESEPLEFSQLLPGKYALLRVSDTGMGIKKDIMDKIFNPYFTTKEMGKGTGLGLSVVQGIVKSFKGDIRIYSEPDIGTEVHVYLPIIEEELDDKTSDPSQSIKGGNERILLVDDEEAIIEMEQQLLTRLGYHVTSLSSSLKALEFFKANPDNFDLIITDMTMPDMTGAQLANEIHKIKLTIPIILCTGFSDLINEETSREMGIQGYISKPVVKREIALTIREALDNSLN